MKKIVSGLLVLILLLSFGCVGLNLMPSEEMLKAREKVVNNPNDPFAHFSLGEVYERVDQHQKAIDSYEDATRIKPDYADAHWGLGYAYEELGQYQKAIESYKEAIWFNPDHEDAHWGLAYTYERLGRYDEAIAQYKEAIRFGSNITPASHNLKILEKKREGDRLVQEEQLHLRILEKKREDDRLVHEEQLLYEKIRINPNDASAHFDLGVFYNTLDRNREAIVEFKSALRIEPDHLWASLYLKDLLLSKKRRVTSHPPLSLSEKNIYHAQEQVRLYPDNAGVHLILGDLYEKQGRIDDAIASFKEAVRINPNNANMRIVLGHAYINVHKYGDAIAAYKEALRINPNLDAVRESLIVLEQKKKSEKQPLEKEQENNPKLQLYKQEILSDPGNYMAHVNLGSAYTNNGQFEKAIYEFEKAIIINPMDALAYVGLGTLYFRVAGDFHKSGQVEKSATELNKAIRQYKKANKLNPQNPSFIYTLGTMYDLNKEGSNAIISMMKAQNLYLAKQDPKGVADCKRNLRVYFERYKFKPEDFENTDVTAVPMLLSKERQSVPGGTGFLFSSKDYIITNYHVVKGASSIEVKFPDGEIIKASVQAKDSQNDIAVLKLAKSPSTQIPDLKFGDSSKVRPGDKVFTIGYPASSILGENQKITDGIISSVTGINDDPTMFQITVPIQPGNSGGPLFNEKGEVIGITTASLSLNAIQSLGAVPQNVNYAIKSSFVNNLLTTIPKTLLSNRGIVVVPNKPGNSLSDFFDRVSNNVVLIEAK
jgi:tetratricopeptide (TPR) repeat protein